MNSEKVKNQNNLEDEESLEKDPIELKRAKEVIQFFGKAFSLLKVYPRDNPSVKNSINIFIEKMKEFLDEYEELKITIEEFSFSFNGEIIFQDEEKKKSLPFLFFKDGMRELSFHKGLEREELQDLLEIIKENSDLPHEDSDIVNSLWEKDYPNILYFALDEFLESDIGGVEGEIGFSIDKQEFSKGTINLTPEDIKEVHKRSQALGVHVEKEDEEGERKHQDSSSFVSQFASISEGEIPEIDYMLSNSREPSRISELVTLIFEVFFLEETKEQFAATLNVLEQCHQEGLHKAEFAFASSILSQMEELREMLSGQSEEKCKLLDNLLRKIKDESSLTTMKKLFLGGRIVDLDSFFQYLTLIGPKTIPLIGALWEDIKDPLVRLKASNFLCEIGQEDLDSLVRIVQDNKVSLTKEVIAILAKIGDRKVIPHLENFVSFKNKAIKLETIKTLGKIEDETSNQILLKFLSDEDEEVRTVALMNLRYLGDKTALDSVMKLALDKNFNKKRVTEKKAILHFLARTRSEEVYPFFQNILKKSTILAKSKIDETRLCAVSALEIMATPKAKEILKEGTQLRNKMIRQVCKLILRKMAALGESDKNIKGEHHV